MVNENAMMPVCLYANTVLAHPLLLQSKLTLALHMALISLIFVTWLSMNFWPPKPGFTDMTRMRSHSSMTYSMELRGVAGFSTIPALQPRSLIWKCVGGNKQVIKMTQDECCDSGYEWRLKYRLGWNLVCLRSPPPPFVPAKQCRQAWFVPSPITWLFWDLELVIYLFYECACKESKTSGLWMPGAKAQAPLLTYCTNSCPLSCIGLGNSVCNSVEFWGVKMTNEPMNERRGFWGKNVCFCNQGRATSLNLVRICFIR